MVIDSAFVTLIDTLVFFINAHVHTGDERGLHVFIVSSASFQVHRPQTCAMKCVFSTDD